MNRKGAKLCTGTTVEGVKCQRFAVRGTSRCSFHPAKPSEAPSEVPLETSADAKAFIGRTVREMRDGKIDPRLGNAIAQALNVFLKAVEISDAFREAQELREAMKERERGRNANTASGTQASPGSAFGAGPRPEA